MRNLLRPDVCGVALWAGMLACAAHGQLPLRGVNLAGAEFGEQALPGVYGTHYTYPTAAEVDYFVGKGMNALRLPFRWERLQRSLNAPLDPAELGRLDQFVQHATSRGATVILDPHNYARYHGQVVGGGVSNASFADFWSRLASRYANHPRVVFGLMNEPHSMPTEQWTAAANAAIAAIRSAGANNLILAPGNAWTGAHSWSQDWYGVPNAEAMLTLVDPADNLAVEVHQYLDGDSSGRSAEIISETIGVERLAGFTRWLQENNLKGFLGEFAAANSTFGEAHNQIGDEAIAQMLNHLEQNADVWLGWTWWAAGPWWGEYQFTLAPNQDGDRPAMGTLAEFLDDPALLGDYNRDGRVDAADYTVWRDAVGQPVAAPFEGPDGTGDAFVDAADYAVWASQYGQSAGLSARAPSPRAFSCAAAACLAALALRPERVPTR